MTASGVMDGKRVEGKRTGFWTCIFSPAVLKKNLVIAAVVCVVLTAANQYDVLVSEPWTLRFGLKVLFNFVVPLVVSSVSAWFNRQTS